MFNGQSCPPPKLIIHPVPVPQAPKVILKEIPVTLPPRIIVKVVRIPVGQGLRCPPPRVIQQPTPIFYPPKTVVKEVPIPQLPRIVIKEVPVPQPRVIVKYVPLPLVQGTQCPAPRVILQKIPVLQPPRVIIKEVPIAQPARTIVKEILVPQPPRIVIKKIPVYSPLARPSPGMGINCPALPILIAPVNCITPTSYIDSLNLPGFNFAAATNFKQQLLNLLLKQQMCSHVLQKITTKNQLAEINRLKWQINGVPSAVPGTPNFANQLKCPPIIKEVPVPRVVIKEVPVPVINGRKCPAPKVIIQRVPQPVFIPQPGNQLSPNCPPPQVIIKPELQQAVQIQGQVINFQKSEIYRLEQEVKKLLAKLSACSPYMNNPSGLLGVSQNLNPLFNGGLNGFVSPVPQNLCVVQLRKQSIRIQQLKYRLKQLLSSRSSNRKPSVRPSVMPISPPPIPMMHVLKSLTPSAAFPLVPSPTPSTSSTGLQTLFVKALHEAFSHTQQALTHCMNAVLMQQLALNQSQINNNPICKDHQQLLEEKQLAEGQIRFLNSIIVDMQKKNDEQRARIEILESGYSPAAADELKLYGLPVQSIPPRVYCDICEEFDKHETEDCPLQATEADPLPCYHPRAKRDASSDRPYCEICEMFGHCTEDCKDDQTF